ncbi:ATP-binding cassette sub-family C member 9-like [Ptychodera flava]|uniref:ATP-binding cassette sub-family C member 9-like n=1 Tax=Ptychodera flava TaxID=63121 RepID=UPI003969EAE3
MVTTTCYKQPLEMEDIGALPEEHAVDFQYQEFKNAYEEECVRAKKKNATPSLWRTYGRAYGKQMAIAGLLKFISDLFQLVPPIAVGGVVAYASNFYYSDTTLAKPVFTTPYITFSEFISNGFVLVFLMFVTTAMFVLTYQYHFYKTVVESIHVRTAIQAYVYEKSLRLPMFTISGGEMTMGQITNHMSTDAFSVMWMFQFIHFVWTAPIQALLILILLYVELGVAALCGAAVLLIMTPIQFRVGAAMSKVQKNVMLLTDERLKKSNELLQGIKLLKLYGWEELFCSAIEVVRSQEVTKLMKNGLYLAATWFLTDAAPVTVTLVSFAVYSVISPTPLTPEVAFASLALFNTLVIPLFMVPVVVSHTVNGYVSTQRLRKFFCAREIERKEIQGDRLTTENEDNGHGSESLDLHQIPEVYVKSKPSRLPSGYMTLKQSLLTSEGKDTTRLLTSGSNMYGTFDEETNVDEAKIQTVDDDNNAIEVHEGNFTWDPESTKPTISDINLRMPKGKLTMIVGLVGSGKSSLVSAMLGEMTNISGSVNYNSDHGRISYCAQKAWLRNATLRDNIVFGEMYDPKRYQRVLSACALEPDIEILPGGDMTEIGEKGINLSGGQKQRVSVARAMYSQTDIVILDDPLSALDVHVGKQVFEEGIQNFLLENQRTVILVTHQLQYLQEAEKIIVMDNGKVYRQGDIGEIAKLDPDLYREWKETANLISESEGSDGEAETAEQERENLKKQISVVGEGGEKRNEAGVTIIEEEERERGSISLRVYYSFVNAIKVPLFFLSVLLLALGVTCMAVTNFWLSQWSEAGANITGMTEEEIDEDTKYYLSVYAILSCTTMILLGTVATCYITFAIKAAKRIHLALIRHIIHAPMRFFDTTPIGRILNRLASDTQIIDQKLWQAVYLVIESYIQVIAAIVVNTIVTPIYIVVIIPIILGYYFIQRYFITTSRELQRLNSISKSPIFAHFSETLGGLSTVRAYRVENPFRRRIKETISTNNAAYLYLETMNRWLGVRLDFIGALIVLFVGLACLITVAVGSLQPSYVGLSLTYALNMASYMNWMVRQTTDCELQMNALERVMHYTHIPIEEYRGIYDPSTDWPNQGDIQFEGVYVRYAQGLDSVLQDVTLHFKSGQKIGICGRTGSGKSSLTLALFRMIDTFKGRIVIDDVDISHVGLLTLRSRLAIIPQDPVLFQGTIRFNLDPETTRSDEELWEALEIAQLKTLVSELDMKLDSVVTEGGENFSVGQRQLFCLARAFLRKARILLMDEATASIDIQTDAVLQNVVATAFEDRTVITIAHRISTILDSDMVMVLSDGKIMEYDTPTNLLQIDDSMFSSLVNGDSKI